jgi:hypothetical protein
MPGYWPTQSGDDTSQFVSKCRFAGGVYSIYCHPNRVWPNNCRDLGSEIFKELLAFHAFVAV